MNASSSWMQPVPAAGTTLTVSLIALTFSTGLIDALSFIALGHVFTANMTGNIIFLAFAVSGIKNLSAARSGASLLAFMAGAVFGGLINIRHSDWTQTRLLKRATAVETALLLIVTILAVKAGSKTEIPSDVIYVVIVLTAFAMGLRNAVVRKLALPDLTTTVLTLTVTGIASDSSLAGGSNPRWRIRATAVVTMFAGAAVGAILLRFGVFAPLAASSLVAFAVLAWISARSAR
jgi:uncharacterized membrane protein YoaK (UPF0700 family)